MEPPLESPDDQRRQRLLFVTARAAEYEDCLREFNFEKHLNQNHPYFRHEGSEWDIRVTHTGIGPDQAQQTLRKIDGSLEPDFILVAGTAGSLSIDLERDSIYLPTAIRSAEGSPKNDWYHPETEILHWIRGVLDQRTEQSERLRSGPLLSADEPVVDPDARRQLKEQNQALAVDMETSTVIDFFG
ncbi:MAG: hypothetical protein ABEK50_05230, partial [bacterium]